MEASRYDLESSAGLLTRLSTEHNALWRDCVDEISGTGQPKAINLHDALHTWLDEGDKTPVLQLFQQLPSKVHLPPIAILLAAHLTRKLEYPLLALSHPSCPERGWGPPPALLHEACARLKDYAGQIADPTPVISRFATCGAFPHRRLLMATCLNSGPLPEEIVQTLEFSRAGEYWQQPNWLPSPDHLDTIDYLGLLPTMVGPFPYRSENVDFVFLRSPAHSNPWICLRCTPTDTLILARDVFEQTLTAWCIWQRREAPIVLDLPA